MKSSSGFDYLSSLYAARADAQALNVAANHGAHGLEIWLEAAMSAVIGVADAIAKLWPLAAYLAAFRHQA
jgi:hypothetical protein